MVYERKIDVAAERERLTKELDRLTRVGARDRAVDNEAFSPRRRQRWSKDLKTRKAEVELLVEKTNEGRRAGPELTVSS